MRLSKAEKLMEERVAALEEDTARFKRERKADRKMLRALQAGEEELRSQFEELKAGQELQLDHLLKQSQEAVAKRIEDRAHHAELVALLQRGHEIPDPSPTPNIHG